MAGLRLEIGTDGQKVDWELRSGHEAGQDVIGRD